MKTSSSRKRARLPWLAIAGVVTTGFFSTPASAVTTVAPNALSSTEGDFAFGLFTTASRTYQIQFAASQLTDLAIGSQITGLSFRLNGGVAAAPAANVSVSDLEITLAEATNAITSFSSTTANNMSNSVLVRDGAYSLAMGSYPGGATPNAWGPSIGFTNAYSYQGGDLVILISQSGFTGATGFFDAITSNASSGYVARWGSGFQLSDLSQSANSIGMQLHVAAIPEPGTSALAVALGSVAFVACRRRRRA